MRQIDSVGVREHGDRLIGGSTTSVTPGQCPSRTAAAQAAGRSLGGEVGQEGPIAERLEQRGRR